LDIGAHHPFIYSNTALLYKLGWIGINIDAFPGSMKLFNKVRKRDLNLEIGISSQKSDLDFYIFEERELNTFDREIYKMQVSRGKVFECTKKIQCLTFNAIIEKYVTSNNSIDLITIDIEGHELNVIKTINFNLIHPQLFIIEFIESSIDKVLTSEINNILNVNDYYLVASLGNSQIFSKNGRKYLR
jgi:FkbM family methyltransferase